MPARRAFNHSIKALFRRELLRPRRHGVRAAQISHAHACELQSMYAFMPSSGDYQAPAIGRHRHRIFAPREMTTLMSDFSMMGKIRPCCWGRCAQPSTPEPGWVRELPTVKALLSASRRLVSRPTPSANTMIRAYTERRRADATKQCHRRPRRLAADGRDFALKSFLSFT